MTVHMFSVEVYNQTQPRRPITGLDNQTQPRRPITGLRIVLRHTDTQTDSPNGEMAQP